MPPESSSAVVLHATSTPAAANTCDYGDRAIFHTEVEGYSSSNKMRIISHNESALDALAALAAASTAVSQCPDEPASHYPPQHITTHQDSTPDDHEANSMPPPPSRSPAILLATSTESIDASHDYKSSAPVGQTFTYSTTYDREDYPSPPSITSSYIGGGRLRSASNPEGMEKWDLYSHRNDRQHFVLPSSILEEELASTRRVLGEIVDEESGEYVSSNSDEAAWGMSQDFTPNTQEALESASSSAMGIVKGGFHEHYSTSDMRKSKRMSRLGTSPDSVLGLDETAKSNKNSSMERSNSKPRKKSTRSPSPSDIIINSPPSDEDDEANLEPEELLRRARARLLEDLSEGCDYVGSNSGLNADNKASALILPHSLTKYKEVSLLSCRLCACPIIRACR